MRLNRAQPGQRSASNASVSSSEGQKWDDEDEAPAVAPEYGDLLDANLLERSADTVDPDDDLVDVGLTLDLADRDDVEGLAMVVDLDVGTLLTSLPPAAAVRDERDLGEDALASGALREVLLPEEHELQRRTDDDEAVGDDERFPAFDATSELLPSSTPVEDEPEADV
jgi:hypothetical protein